MKLIKIGSDYFNLEHLLRITDEKDGTFTLRFIDGIEKNSDSMVTITKENLDSLLKIIGTYLLGSIKNDLEPSESDGKLTFQLDKW